MEICAGTETVSAYSQKPHLPPHLSHLTPFFLPALRHVQYFEMVENVKNADKKNNKKLEEVALPSALQLTFSSRSWIKPSSGAGGVLMMSGPIADIRSNIPQHWDVASPPTIKSSLAPRRRGRSVCSGPLPAPAPLSHPNLSVTDRTDLPCSNPPPCQ